HGRGRQPLRSRAGLDGVARRGPRLHRPRGGRGAQARRRAAPAHRAADGRQGRDAPWPGRAHRAWRRRDPVGHLLADAGQGDRLCARAGRRPVRRRERGHPRPRRAGAGGEIPLRPRRQARLNPGGRRRLAVAHPCTETSATFPPLTPRDPETGMSEIPGDLKFMKSHEWARIEGDGKVTIGISDHAQGLLGDLVYVELPAVGDSVEAGAACAVVESVKAASDVYAPVSGTVTAVNAALADKPETINEDAYGEGWLLVVEVSEPDQLNDLLDPDDYAELLEEDDH